MPSPRGSTSKHGSDQLGLSAPFARLDEFTFRLNEGNVARHTMERLDSFVVASAGKRLTYKRLIR